MSREKIMSASEVQVESVVFPAAVKPPGSDKTLFLGGAGVRGMKIHGNFVKFTAIAVYLEDTAVPALSVKWKGKTADELADSQDFIAEIITGHQYSEKVAENCNAPFR